MDTRVLIQSASKNYAAFPPVMLQITFDQDWPTGLRDIHVRKCKIFVIQGQVTPECVVRSGPKSNSSELLMLVLVTCNFDDDSIKNKELAWRQHFPIISLWDFFRRSRAANSVVSGPMWPKFEHSEILCMSSYKKDWLKTTEKMWRHRFPHYKSMETMDARVLI